MSTTYAWAPITKTELQDDGTLMVYGPAADAGPDRDKQRLDQAWLDQAMPAWLAEGGNVREMHQTIAAGVGVGLAKGDGGEHLLAACVVDPTSVKKCLPGPNGRPPVLKGFSVGIKDPQLQFGKADAPNGVVVAGKIIEVSLVDRPANPRTTFTVAKADGLGVLQAVEAPELVESPDNADMTDDDADAEDAPTSDDTEAAEKADEPDATKADSDAKGTMPNAGGDPSYPINSKADLRKAIRAVGRGGADHNAIRRHVIARAKALGLADMIPDNWNTDGSLKTATKSEEAPVGAEQEDLEKADTVDAGRRVLATIAALLPDAVKADGIGDGMAAADGGAPDGVEVDDIAGAQEAIARIAALIVSEAQSLAAGNIDEAYDISCLLDAVAALKWFMFREQDEATADAVAALAVLKSDSPDEPVPPAETEPDPEPEPAPAAAAAAVAKAEAPDMLTKTDVADLVKAQMAEVTKAHEEREQELLAKVATMTEQIDALKADVTKALELPLPGGPVLTRTDTQEAAARRSDADLLRAEARTYLAKADATTDPQLRQGYRDLAREKTAQADKLT